MTHEGLKQAAMDAIIALHSDSDVGLEVTLESLQEVDEMLQSLIEAVEADIEMRDEDDPE